MTMFGVLEDLTEDDSDEVCALDVLLMTELEVWTDDVVVTGLLDVVAVDETVELVLKDED